MISTRWSTENSHLTPRTPQRQAVAKPPRQPLLERPAVLLGVALATGIAIGLLVKWGWRR